MYNIRELLTAPSFDDVETWRHPCVGHAISWTQPNQERFRPPSTSVLSCIHLDPLFGELSPSYIKFETFFILLTAVQLFKYEDDMYFE